MGTSLSKIEAKISLSLEERMRRVWLSSKVRISVCWPRIFDDNIGPPLELASHPDVLEVSVVARPHPKWGERPMAFVILKTQVAAKWAGKHAEFETELKRHAKTRLPGFACPEWVKVVEELPVSDRSRLWLWNS